MKRFATVLTFAAAVSALALVFDSPEVRAEDAKCGEKGQPSCPLQGWMEKNLQDPLDKKDLAKVAAGLEKAAGMAPDPKWNEGDKGWAKLAKDGAAAAKAGDTAALQKSCKGCHKAWRSPYKKEHRLRPVAN